MQTILVAEDSAGVRKMVADILRKEGYQVLAAASGQEAIAASERHPGTLDLLITDIVMAGMGGAELYAWLKAEHPELEVLFISGFMSREPLEGSFLKKPFTRSELADKVREILPADAA
jgi:two-component system, cell cycle sensor histidine kinase and response regulator CckA